MIIRKDNSYIRNDRFPNSDWLGLEDAFVLDDNSPLTDKVLTLFPNFKVIADDAGNVTDIMEEEFAGTK